MKKFLLLHYPSIIGIIFMLIGIVTSGKFDLTSMMFGFFWGLITYGLIIWKKN